MKEVQQTAIKPGLLGFLIAIGPLVTGTILYIVYEGFGILLMAYILVVSLIGDGVLVYFFATHLKEGMREAFIRGVRTGILLTVLLAFALAIYELSL